MAYMIVKWNFLNGSNLSVFCYILYLYLSLSLSLYIYIYHTLTVADPEFHRGGGNNPSGGAPTYDFAKFCQIFPKLHEIERIWTPGRRPSHPLRSATD